MPSTLVVQLTDEHLNRIHQTTPVNGIAELIWNAVDADALNITIDYERNVLSGIEKIIITDDGHGIYYEDIEFTFGKLGNSHKLTDGKTPQGRLYHGKTGQGRYKAFALGKKITWETCYKDKQNGDYYKFNLIGYAHELTKLDVSEKQCSDILKAGTKVTIESVYEEKTNSLNDSNIVSERISVIMAPYLFAYYGINIGIEGFKVDPNDSINKATDFPFSTTLLENNSKHEISGVAKIIEWKNGKNRRIFLCNSKGVTYDEDALTVKKANFTVYVMSDFIEQMHLKNELILKEANPQFRVLSSKIYEIIRDYQREKLASEASKTVQKLKEENVYPYEGKPLNKIEEVERQVFDICAVKVHEYLPDFTKNSKPSKKLTLQLLKQAMIQNPSSLNTILKDVLELSLEQQDELAELLEKTSLASIINTTKIVTERLTFINGLEQILYNGYYEKHLKERSQLHKILLNELWIFGDQYEYVTDDISLKNVLKEHINQLGRTELIENIDFNNLKGLDDIPDLCLWSQYNYGKPDVYENLVIELKRPKCIISDKEISQIKKYAIDVQREKYFDKEKTSWTFILVGTKLNNYAKSECEQDDREFGHIINKKNLNVFIKEWNQIIQEAKGRLNFIKTKLEYKVVDNSEGLSYLTKKYKELMP